LLFISFIEKFITTENCYHELRNISLFTIARELCFYVGLFVKLGAKLLKNLQMNFTEFFLEGWASNKEQ